VSGTPGMVRKNNKISHKDGNIQTAPDMDLVGLLQGPRNGLPRSRIP
jgi:hypothetical protein